ncbi:CbtA family protein [Actinacidiphila rubida]|uniref:Probable cobalt transporter subunit (CbtA) n=1 Tax=Actinacidiphila rubida TaxID=310780 RepID=A0A1H8TD07_9ACTN|nr:CbtA family protein [Actinacidiphila rubida]SEO88626.1 Probable cobalt transporter subunit (CbtA) [Actinacidiphila rubida]
MVKRIIGRGLLAGAVAGLLAFAFARIFAEPQIDKAIAYESGRDAAQEALDKAAGLPPDMGGGPDLFSRTVQADVGLGVGMVFFGMAMGALFAVAYLLCLGRTGRLRARTLSVLVAGGGLLGFYVVPFLKYPANPPAIGHAETIQQRGSLYLVMVLCSVVFLAGAVWLGQRLQTRFGNWNATLLGAAAYVVAIGIVMALLPSLGDLSDNVRLYGHHATETPLPLTDPRGHIVYPGFPADVLFGFRLFSVLAQLVLWGAIGLVFAPMAQRLLQPAPAGARPKEASPGAGSAPDPVTT